MNYIKLFISFNFFLLLGASVSAQVSPLEFRFVCEGEVSGCVRDFGITTGDELWVENKPVLVMDDVESASLNNRLEKVGDIKVGGKIYEITIKFKDQVKLEDITTKNIGKRLGIFLDHKLIFVPTIMEPLSNGNMTMSVDQLEFVLVKRLVDYINSAVNKEKGIVPNNE